MKNLRHQMAEWVPPRMSDRPGKNRGWRYLYSMALAADATVEFALQGMLARLPGEGTNTALPRIGRDRRIVRGAAESAAAFIERLKLWRTSWRGAGNPYTLMHQIRGFVAPHKPLLRIVNANGTWYTLNPDDTIERLKTHPASNWDWDGNAAAWSRFWVIIYPPAGLWVRDGVWGDTELWGQAGQGTWGSSATVEEIAGLRNLIAEWKSAGAVCVKIVVSFDAGAFAPTDTSPPLPDGTWADNYKIVGGVAVPARDQRAIYWEGVA